jgi:hypothetical protein
MVNKQSRLSSPEPAALNIGNGRAELGEIVVFIEGHTETSRILERRHTSPGARRAPSQRVHAAGARNYPAGDVRPCQGHRERDRGALGATPRDRGRLPGPVRGHRPSSNRPFDHLDVPKREVPDAP